MNFKEMLFKLLHKIYRKSAFLNDFFESIQAMLKKIEIIITRLEFLLHFNWLDEQSCEWWESLLKINATNQDIENRRAKIRAKFLACTHNDIELLQKACDSWKNGEIQADFVNGKIELKFIGEYGIPSDLSSLTESIEEIKPAHLPFILLFKYLLIENIHEVKTIEEIENITLENFAFGKEE